MISVADTCVNVWRSRLNRPGGSAAQRLTLSPLCSKPFLLCLWPLFWALNTQMPELFFQGITMDILVPPFSSWSCSQCVIVCVQKDPTNALVVSVTVYTAAAVVRELRYCVLWKGKRSHLFELSEAAPYRNNRQAFETASIPFPIIHPLAKIALIRHKDWTTQANFTHGVLRAAVQMTEVNSALFHIPHVESWMCFDVLPPVGHQLQQHHISSLN